MSRFFFDIDKWRGSIDVQRMTLSERGAYFELMLQQFEKGPIADDATALSEQLFATDALRTEFLRAWPAVRRKFHTVGVGKMHNKRVSETVREQQKYKKDKQDAGRLGGLRSAARRYNATEGRELPASSAEAPLQHNSSDAPAMLKRSLALIDRSDRSLDKDKSSGEAPPPRPVENSAPENENLGVITKIAHEVIDVLGTQNLGDISESVKSRCADLGITYGGRIVAQAIDSAIVQQRSRRPAGGGI